MSALAAAALLAGCHAITLPQAKALVLATPTVERAVQDRGAKPFFVWIGPAPNGWRFDVNARNACAGRVCSALIGHFTVDRRTAVVRTLDTADGGPSTVSGATLRRLRRRFLARC